MSKPNLINQLIAQNATLVSSIAQPKETSSSSINLNQQIAAANAAVPSVSHGRGRKKNEEKEGIGLLHSKVFDFLKSRGGGAMAIKDVETTTGIEILKNDELLQRLRQNEQIAIYDNFLEYRSKYRVQDRESIVATLKEHTEGILASELADGYSSCLHDLMEMADNGDLIALDKTSNPYQKQKGDNSSSAAATAEGNKRSGRQRTQKQQLKERIQAISKTTTIPYKTRQELIDECWYLFGYTDRMCRTMQILPDGEECLKEIEKQASDWKGRTLLFQRKIMANQLVDDAVRSAFWKVNVPKDTKELHSAMNKSSLKLCSQEVKVVELQKRPGKDKKKKGKKAKTN